MRIEVFDTLDSTSAEAARRAKAGEAGPLWILAREQTAGYGRRGRAWETGLGNFAGTLLVRPAGPPARFAELSFVAGLSVYRALAETAQDEALALKWPNDVLARGAKLAGLLLERIDADGAPCVAIGVGVNIVSAPANVGYQTARLIDILKSDAAAPTPNLLASHIDAHWNDQYEVWARGGFAPIRDAWLVHAAGLGAPVTARLPGEILEGVFEGLDENGALILRRDGEKRIIAAGDVFFGSGA